jgi:hypothetical protein
MAFGCSSKQASIVNGIPYKLIIHDRFIIQKNASSEEAFAVIEKF